MQIKFAILAAALSTGVVSDFIIVTRPSFNLGDLNGNFQSKFNSLTAAVASQIGQLTASAGASDLSRARSAQTALASFVATAPSSLSIPSQVTEIGKFTTFESAPAWYTALPSDLKAYYDQQNSKVQSVVNSYAGVTASASPSNTATGATPGKTNAASPDKVVQYMGVGAAAALAGVFAL